MQRVAPRFAPCGYKDLMVSKCKFARLIVSSYKHTQMLF